MRQKLGEAQEVINRSYKLHGLVRTRETGQSTMKSKVLSNDHQGLYLVEAVRQAATQDQSLEHRVYTYRVYSNDN